MANNILETIVEAKRIEVREKKELFPHKLLEQSLYFSARPVSLRSYLARPDLTGVIAEFKRRSPSKGDINPFAEVEQVTIGYMQAGAAALSILTDKKFFGGKNEDLIEARRFNFCPILRKDFIIDEYQVIEARSIGADVVLLIAAILSESDLLRLARLARSLGMEVLVEVHDREELQKVPFEDVDLVGVNNRCLKSFVVDIKTSFDLIRAIPSEVIAVSESGIQNIDGLLQLKEAGYHGFLIGEAFMQESRPEAACRNFLAALRERRACLQENLL